MNEVFPAVPNLTADELSGWTGGHWEGTPPGYAIRGVCHDSRIIWPGALFVAFSGGNGDGRRFIGDALGKGAFAAMAEPDGQTHPVPVLRVRDGFEALARAAAGHRKAVAPHVIGVSGSMGKTTVKEMILAMLKKSHSAWGTHGNWNNRVGLPLSLLNMPRETTEGVFELGVNHPGEMAPLCRILKPDAAVVTNIAPAHIGNFRDLRAIAKEKSILLASIAPEGYAVLDRDSPWFEFLANAARCRIVSVSMNLASSHAAFWGRMLDESEGVVEITGPDLATPLIVRGGLPGEHNARNLLLAAAAVILRGVDPKTLENATTGLTLPPMRWQKQRIGEITLVNDAYNANPEGMRSAIETFAKMPAAAHILMLGDMLELGSSRRREHEKIAGMLSSGNWKRVVLLGDSIRWTYDAALRKGFPRERIFMASSHEQAAGLLKDATAKNCAVLFKASRGMYLEKVVEHFAAGASCPDTQEISVRPRLGKAGPRQPRKDDIRGKGLRSIRRAVVLGGGVSGIAAARLLMGRGVKVTILEQDDRRRLDEFQGRFRAPEGTAEVREDLPAMDADLAVVSPGVPLSHPWVKTLRSAGVVLTGECELAASLWPGKLLAITGTKGKSSVVKLCTEALRLGGVRAEACGNYGKPLSTLVRTSPSIDWGVLEISSFQLELVKTLRPDIGVLLNIYPDHLDRHATMSAYRALKFKIFERQTEADTAFLPEGLPRPPGVAIRPSLRRFGVGGNPDWRYSPGRVVGSGPRWKWEIELSGSWFDNAVLGPLAAAAAGALAECGLDEAPVEKALHAFTPLAHRHQLVGSVDGVRYVDDSKATSLEAMVASVKMTGGPVLLIVGGRLKKDSPARVKEKLVPRVRKVYCIGESAAEFIRHWGTTLECRETGTLPRALARARKEARRGETVLLAPGCASFDQFENYEQRGECFTRLVRAFRPLEKTTREGDVT